jgi:hypothetical protein
MANRETGKNVRSFYVPDCYGCQTAYYALSNLDFCVITDEALENLSRVTAVMDGAYGLKDGNTMRVLMN